MQKIRQVHLEIEEALQSHQESLLLRDGVSMVLLWNVKAC